MEVVTPGLAYDLNVGVEEGWEKEFRIKPHWGICVIRCLEVSFIEIEKIVRGTDF